MRSLISACGLWIMAAGLSAGVHAVYTVNRAPAQDRVDLHVQDAMMRIVYQGAQGDMIFDGNRQMLLILDHERKKYVELNKRMMTAFAQQLDGQYERLEMAKNEIEQRLEKVPADYRDTMREILHNKLAALPQPGEPVSPPVTKDLGPGGRVNGYETHAYEVWEDEAKDLSIWMTDPAAVGLKSFAGFQAIASFFQEIKRVAGNDAFLSRVDSPFRMFREVKGFPVKIEKFRDGESVETSLLTSAEQRNYQAVFFSVPVGYEVVNPFQGR